MAGRQMGETKIKYQSWDKTEKDDQQPPEKKTLREKGEIEWNKKARRNPSEKKMPISKMTRSGDKDYCRRTWPTHKDGN